MVTRALRTAAPEHTLTPALGRLTVAAGHAGLILGNNRDGIPEAVHLFRPEPTTAVFAGSWWTARVLLLRCLGIGATVAVRAGATASGSDALAPAWEWIGLDGLAGATGRRVWAMSGEHLVWLPAEPTAPMLHVYDVGPAGPSSRPVLGAWQTQLTVLSRLTPAGAAAVADADVVLTQRREPAEAELVAAARGRGESTVDTLRTIDDDAIAVWSDGQAGERYVRIVPTAVERELFGAPGTGTGHPWTLANG